MPTLPDIVTTEGNHGYGPHKQRTVQKDYAHCSEFTSHGRTVFVHHMNPLSDLDRSEIQAHCDREVPKW